MMRRIEAEERLAAINDRAAAAGNMQPHDRRKLLGRLERKARGGGRPAAMKARPEVIASMGIAVRIPLSEPAEKVLSDG